MSKKQKQFTDEEKNSIALKAVSGGDDAIKELSEKHNISEEEIRNWIRETGVKPVKEKEEEVSLDASENFIASVSYGANFDNLNYKRLVFWTVFGIAVILIFIQSIIFIHDYTTSSSTQLQSEQSRFYNIEEIQQSDQETLNSFGVVDAEAGIYRIPIDSAITDIANE
ncbi:transposase [Rhodohalobacter sulfatireducens]|uniref:Transposase n=1 Tax=Rhodohalobacter sulfatireducens TaxID=2911366 RepID=A0ABS9KDR6_9BACT|nr:transposase [Rhodohalobacter sulfatireducens]MCG2588973.1 transposase [Rhodohalobacter sulfatireducens]